MLPHLSNSTKPVQFYGAIAVILNQNIITYIPFFLKSFILREFPYKDPLFPVAYFFKKHFTTF